MAEQKHKIAQKFLRNLREKISLRLHMSLLLSAVLASGVLCSKLLLEAGIAAMAVRYAIAALVAYGVFFLVVRAWLAYIVPFHAERKRETDLNLELDEIPGELPRIAGDLASLPGAGGSSAEVFAGGGGNFGGGGASASFGENVADAGGGAATDLSLPDIGDLGDVDDPRALLILVAVGVLIAALCGGAILLIYQAPVILTEVVFEFLLSMGLLRPTRRMRDGNWTGSVLRSTWKAFGLILAAAFGAGLAMDLFCPDQSTIRLVFSACVFGE